MLYIDSPHVSEEPCVCARTYASLRSDMTRVDPGSPVVIILASGSEVLGFDPGRGRGIFSERKNPEYGFLRKGSKAVGPVS